MYIHIHIYIHVYNISVHICVCVCTDIYIVCIFKYRGIAPPSLTFVSRLLFHLSAIKTDNSPYSHRTLGDRCYAYIVSLHLDSTTHEAGHVLRVWRKPSHLVVSSESYSLISFNDQSPGSYGAPKPHPGLLLTYWVVWGKTFHLSVRTWPLKCIAPWVAYKVLYECVHSTLQGRQKGFPRRQTHLPHYTYKTCSLSWYWFCIWNSHLLFSSS